jgi:quercetin dioxygenase-like cupin family protein
MAPCTFLNRIETEAHIPEDGILSRTLFNGEALKVLALGFTSGQELFAHTAPMAALRYFVRGETELILREEKKNVRRGAFVHMPPRTPYGIPARIPLALLLLMQKRVRLEKSS